MTVQSILKFLHRSSVAGAILLLIWWFCMPVFLPIQHAASSFSILIIDPDWIPINTIGLIGMLCLTLGFPGSYAALHINKVKLGFFGLILSFIGLILYTAIQYYETLIWPAVAPFNSNLVEINGALVTGDTAVLCGMIISGVFLSLGYILFALAGLKSKTHSQVPFWLLLLGAPLFGIGVSFILRTLGLLLFAFGTIWLNVQLLKGNHQYKKE